MQNSIHGCPCTRHNDVYPDVSFVFVAAPTRRVARVQEKTDSDLVAVHDAIRCAVLLGILLV